MRSIINVVSVRVVLRPLLLVFFFIFIMIMMIAVPLKLINNTNVYALNSMFVLKKSNTRSVKILNFKVKAKITRGDTYVNVTIVWQFLIRPMVSIFEVNKYCTNNEIYKCREMGVYRVFPQKISA